MIRVPTATRCPAGKRLSALKPRNDKAAASNGATERDGQIAVAVLFRLAVVPGLKKGARWYAWKRRLTRWPLKRRCRRPKRQQIYKERAGVAEFPNAWIKEKMGLRQFHLRGLVKVRLEALWACLTYNICQWIRLCWKPKLLAEAQEEMQNCQANTTRRRTITTSPPAPERRVWAATCRPLLTWSSIHGTITAYAFPGRICP